MPKYVIDTNVPIVANGSNPGVTIDCRIAAVDLLMKALERGVIYLDADGAIQEEYHRYLQPSGQPGVGDLFYREVVNSHPDKVSRVELSKDDDGRYTDLPAVVHESAFDQSDRKFAAVAKKTKSTVYNAVDSDWVEHRELLEDNGIKISFICGCNPDGWLDPLG